MNLDLIVAGQAPLQLPELQEWVAVSQVELASAGSAGYCAVDLSRLGLKVSIFSTVADDPLGEMILKQLELEKVNTEAVNVEPGAVSGIGIYLLLFGSRKRPLTGRLATHPPWPAELDETALAHLKQARLLHLGGYLHYRERWGEPTEELFRVAKEHGLATSLDPQFPMAPLEGKWLPAFGNLLKNVDLIFTDEEEARAITGAPDAEAAARELLKQGPRLAVVKRGAEGAILMTREKTVREPVRPVTEIVDSIGAGDAFDAGIIYGTLQNWQLEKSARFAAAVAACTLKGMGGIQTAPTFSEAEALTK